MNRTSWKAAEQSDQAAGMGVGGSYPPTKEECSFGQVRQRSLFVDEDDGGAYHIVLLLNELTYTS